MNAPSDLYWDELGIAWVASAPEIHVAVPRLQARLRRQSGVILACLGITLPLAVAGLVLGVFTLWSGWTTGTWHFVSRGIAVVSISAILLGAAGLLLPVRASEQAKALYALIDLAIARAERSLKIVRLGFCVCGVAAVLGLVGTAIRSSLAQAPRMSPIVDLGILACGALGLYLYGRHLAMSLSKWRHLKRAIDT